MNKVGKSQVRQITYEHMKQYGESFKSMREFAGIEVKEMAELVGVAKSTYSLWEKGEAIPQVDVRYVDKRIRKIVKDRIVKSEYLCKKYKIIHELFSI